ncbi:MAG TPA: hypothetical protein VMY35_16130 [Phycisphaerae bacterium]|nr:hypothetical protein [Phycisphaerae bacterium]
MGQQGIALSQATMKAPQITRLDAIVERLRDLAGSHVQHSSTILERLGCLDPVAEQPSDVRQGTLGRLDEAIAAFEYSLKLLGQISQAV